MNPEYNELITEVREIDFEAADYLLYKAHKLKDFEPKYYLVQCFTFFDSPQNGEYWYNICGKLSILRRKGKKQ